MYIGEKGNKDRRSCLSSVMYMLALPGIIAAASVAKLRPKQITAFMEGSAQDERCNGLLAYASSTLTVNLSHSLNDIEDTAASDWLAKEIETHCAPL